MFLNQHQRGITKDGIQYWLGRYTATADVTITCHQLRHTFARRLADQRMPIESISKLLGHMSKFRLKRPEHALRPQPSMSFRQSVLLFEWSGG